MSSRLPDTPIEQTLDREGEIPMLAGIVEARWFNRIIVMVILAAAVVVGLETYPGIVEVYGDLLHLFDGIVLAIFITEIGIKIARFGNRPWRYFHDPWNVFDFTIVAVCLLPVGAQYAAVLRLARVLRVMRLMSTLPQLQLLVGALIKSIPSMGYVGILLFINFYIYAVVGVFLFRDNDPVHFRDLPTSMLTLFRVVTLEDWTDVMYIQMYGSDTYPYENITDIPHQPAARPIVGAAYFVSFVMLGTMIMLNLFIGVILNSMNEEQRDRMRRAIRAQRQSGNLPDVKGEFAEIEYQLDDLRESIKRLSARFDERPSA